MKTKMTTAPAADGGPAVEADDDPVAAGWKAVVAAEGYDADPWGCILVVGADEV